MSVLAQKQSKTIGYDIYANMAAVNFCNRFFFSVNQKMKMIGHQTIGKCVTVRRYMMTVFPQKIQIIFSCVKYLLTVITLIVDVIQLLF